MDGGRHVALDVVLADDLRAGRVTAVVQYCFGPFAVERASYWIRTQYIPLVGEEGGGGGYCRGY